MYSVNTSAWSESVTLLYKYLREIEALSEQDAFFLKLRLSKSGSYTLVGGGNAPICCLQPPRKQTKKKETTKKNCCPARLRRDFAPRHWLVSLSSSMSVAFS